MKDMHGYEMLKGPFLWALFFYSQKLKLAKKLSVSCAQRGSMMAAWLQTHSIGSSAAGTAKTHVTTGNDEGRTVRTKGCFVSV